MNNIALVALAAGELQDQMAHELDDDLSDGDPGSRFLARLARLVSKRLISDRDAEQLGRFNDLAVSDPTELGVWTSVAAEIRQRVSTGSPVAIAIASIACRHIGAESELLDRQVSSTGGQMKTRKDPIVSSIEAAVAAASIAPAGDQEAAVIAAIVGSVSINRQL